MFGGLSCVLNGPKHIYIWLNGRLNSNIALARMYGYKYIANGAVVSGELLWLG